MVIKNTNIWKFFSSIKLAIWLLAIIAILSLIGTFIPQNETPAFYIDKIGHAGYSFLLKTGLGNVYCSWWFTLLLTLLSLNLAVCLLNRLPIKIRSLGTFIAHLGILVILLGAFIGIVSGEKGLIKINKTEEISSFISKVRSVDPGFSIRLDDFIYTEHIDPKEKLLVYSARDDQDLLAGIPTEIGAWSDIAQTGYKVKILRYLSDFTMDTVTKVAISRSAKADNPAIQVQLKSRAGEISTFWVFARFPDMHQKMDSNFKFIYHWVGRRPKDFISKITILKHGKEMISSNIRVNEPFRFDGYTFFQFSYDTEALSWSELQIVKDPGVSVVYSGFVLLILGLVSIFYVNPLSRRPRSKDLGT